MNEAVARLAFLRWEARDHYNRSSVMQAWRKGLAEQMRHQTTKQGLKKTKEQWGDAVQITRSQMGLDVRLTPRT